MKQTYLVFFLLFTLAFVSCRKSGNDVDIKTYDNNQIQAHIAANGYTNMKRDTTGGDTTGIYYEILRKGRGVKLDYDTRISFTYTIKSLDGKYAITDTVIGRSYNAVGLLTPKGLMMAVHNIIKNKGTAARFLMPSRLAYGASGSGTGSGRLPGNESLEYYVNVLGNDNTAAMAAYDDISIRQYCTANNFDINSFTRKPSGLYVKVTQAGTGTVVSNATSTLSVVYTGFLFNNSIFDQSDQTSTVGTPIDLNSAIAGWQEGLQGLTAGAKVQLLIPSRLAYGVSPQTSVNSSGQTVTNIPTSSSLRFDINLITVTNN